METPIDRILRDLSAAWQEIRRFAAFWGPTPQVPAWLAPGLAIGALLALVLVSGVAVVSLASLLTALLTAHLLLAEVFGINVALGPPR